MHYKSRSFCLTEQAIPSSKTVKIWLQNHCWIVVYTEETSFTLTPTSTASLPLPQLIHAQSQTLIIEIHSLTTAWSLSWPLSPVRGCMLFRNTGNYIHISAVPVSKHCFLDRSSANNLILWWKYWRVTSLKLWFFNRLFLNVFYFVDLRWATIIRSIENPSQRAGILKEG